MSFSPAASGIAASPVPWLDPDAPESDVVLFSRIRILRNLSGFPFPANASRAVRQSVSERIAAVLEKQRDQMFSMHCKLALSELGREDRTILAERRLIPAETVNAHHARLLFLPEDAEQPVALTNVLAHLHLSLTLPGLSLETVRRGILPFAQALAEQLAFAFHPEFGFLTERPQDAGEALTASALLHLPAIRMTGRTDVLFRGLSALRMDCIPFSGGKEDSYPGALFLLHTCSSLGEPCEDLLARFQKVLKSVIAEERRKRSFLREKQREVLADVCGRAFGLLRYSHLLHSGEDALDALSSLKLGVDTGLIQGVAHDILHRMLLPVQPGHIRYLASLQKSGGESVSQADCSILRAAMLRKAVSGDESAGPVSK